MTVKGLNNWLHKLIDCSELFDLSPQTLKYSSKSHPGGDHRHEKMRDSSDVTPPCKMVRRSDSPENKHIDSTGHSRAKAVHTHRARDRDGGETQWSLRIKWVQIKERLLTLMATDNGVT